MKVCSKCNNLLSLDSFTNDKNGKDGRLFQETTEETCTGNKTNSTY